MAIDPNAYLNKKHTGRFIGRKGNEGMAVYNPKTGNYERYTAEEWQKRSLEHRRKTGENSSMFYTNRFGEDVYGYRPEESYSTMRNGESWTNAGKNPYANQYIRNDNGTPVPSAGLLNPDFVAPESMFSTRETPAVTTYHGRRKTPAQRAQDQRDAVTRAILEDPTRAESPEFLEALVNNPGFADVVAGNGLMTPTPIAAAPEAPSPHDPRAIAAAMQQDTSWAKDVDFYDPEVLAALDGAGIYHMMGEHGKFFHANKNNPDIHRGETERQGTNLSTVDNLTKLSKYALDNKTGVQEFLNLARGLHVRDPEAFEQWELANPEMAIRYHARAKAPNGNVGGIEGYDHGKRAQQLAFWHSKENLGYGEDGKKDGRAIAFDFDQFNDVNSESGDGDFWKLGTAQTFTNDFSDFVEDNPWEVAAMVAATIASAGAGMAAATAASAGGAASAATTAAGVLAGTVPTITVPGAMLGGAVTAGLGTLSNQLIMDGSVDLKDLGVNAAIGAITGGTTQYLGGISNPILRGGAIGLTNEGVNQLAEGDFDFEDLAIATGTGAAVEGVIDTVGDIFHTDDKKDFAKGELASKDEFSILREPRENFLDSPSALREWDDKKAVFEQHVDRLYRTTDLGGLTGPDGILSNIGIPSEYTSTDGLVKALEGVAEPLNWVLDKMGLAPLYDPSASLEEQTAHFNSTIDRELDALSEELVQGTRPEGDILKERRDLQDLKAAGPNLIDLAQSDMRPSSLTAARRTETYREGKIELEARLANGRISEEEFSALEKDLAEFAAWEINQEQWDRVAAGTRYDERFTDFVERSPDADLTGIIEQDTAGNILRPGDSTSVPIGEVAAFNTNYTPITESIFGDYDVFGNSTEDRYALNEYMSLNPTASIGEQVYTAQEPFNGVSEQEYMDNQTQYPPQEYNSIGEQQFYNEVQPYSEQEYFDNQTQYPPQQYNPPPASSSSLPPAGPITPEAREFLLEETDKDLFRLARIQRVRTLTQREQMEFQDLLSTRDALLGDSVAAVDEKSTALVQHELVDPNASKDIELFDPLEDALREARKA